MVVVGSHHRLIKDESLSPFLELGHAYRLMQVGGGSQVAMCTVRGGMWEGPRLFSALLSKECMHSNSPSQVAFHIAKLFPTVIGLRQMSKCLSSSL